MVTTNNQENINNLIYKFTNQINNTNDDKTRILYISILTILELSTENPMFKIANKWLEINDYTVDDFTNSFDGFNKVFSSSSSALCAYWLIYNSKGSLPNVDSGRYLSSRSGLIGGTDITIKEIIFMLDGNEHFQEWLEDNPE
jgi:hypothetical protein